MDFKQFNTLLEYGKFIAFEDNGEQKVGVLPIYQSGGAKIDAVINQILENGENYPFKISELNEYASKYMPLRMAKINSAFNILQTSSLEDIAQKSQEERLNILERIMPPQPKSADIEKLFPHKEKVAQLLFGLKFSENFWKTEEKLTFTFVNRLQIIPNIKQKIANWQQLEKSAQTECLQQIADVFCKTYQIEPIKISFFTLEEYRKKQIEQGLNPQNVPPTGQADLQKREISYCEERMKDCDNYVPIYLTFHEALHISQRERNFEPMAERMLNPKLTYFKLVTEEAYLLEPAEIHAYAMDALVKQEAQENLRVAFVDNKYDSKTKQAVKQVQITASVLHAYNVRK